MSSATKRGPFAFRIADSAQSRSLSTQVGAVVIGRNEGERLHRCLESLTCYLDKVVYVDSGSTDDSCAYAANTGIDVVQLNLSIPFTAARARNEGIQALLSKYPEVEFVQVVDGDCIVAEGWLVAALTVLEQNRGVAIVCGQRKELQPNATIYNRLCDMEWKGAAGMVPSCGGDALIRLAAFQQVGGYNPTLIAGEEPELCVRLRQLKWKIQRTNDTMTWHDAAMTKLSQWWQRARRSGHTYAEGHALHGRSDEKFRRSEVRSIAFWGGIVPVATILLAIPTLGASLAVAGYGYASLYCRVRNRRIDSGETIANAALYAKLTVLGKLPQFSGMLQFACNRIFRRKSALIEYK